MTCKAHEALILARIGFLAFKAEQYAQFPSIRKMSDDWHQIALIAADAYNALAAHDCVPREVAEQARGALKEGRHIGVCSENSELTPTTKVGFGPCSRCIALAALDKALGVK